MAEEKRYLSLLGYYNQELAYLRQLGAEFAKRYPKVASRLVLDADGSEDPHVERLIEAFAFVAARIQLKVDDEFPEITESFLDILYPNLLAPVPSMSVVQFVTDPVQMPLQTGQEVARHSSVVTRPVDGTACRFRTAYPVKIWPVEVKSVRFELPYPGIGPSEGVRSVMRLELKTHGGIPFRELRAKASDGTEIPLQSLRFYLKADDVETQFALYEHLLNNVVGVDFRPGGPKDVPSPVSLPSSCIQPVGLGRDEGMLPYSVRSFMGYRLLQEYFCFPQKFLFFDLTGLEKAAVSPFADTLEVVFYFRKQFPFEKRVSAQTFRLNCTPIVNLFHHTAEPIRLSHLQPEYRVIPDIKRQDTTEIYSVDAVTSIDRETGRVVEYLPFYSFKHGIDRKKSPTFWFATRKESQREGNDGWDVYLSLVDLGFQPSRPETDTISVEVFSTNRDLPSRLPYPMQDGDLHLEAAGVFSAIRCIEKPTKTYRVPLERGLHWRLISHLTLNVLSLLEDDETHEPEAFREILRLYDASGKALNQQQIQGITRLHGRRILRSIGTMHASFVRGLEVSIEFDEQQFIGSSAFLFAQVLERFFALYVSINSFSEMIAYTRQREGPLKRWPARTGDQFVL